MKRKLICYVSVVWFCSNGLTYTSGCGNVTVPELQHQVYELQKENDRLHRENNQLRAIIKEQNQVLVFLAKSKHFIVNHWTKIRTQILDLNRRVNEKIKEIDPPVGTFGSDIQPNEEEVK